MADEHAPAADSGRQPEEGRTISQGGFVTGPDGVVYPAPKTPEEAEELRRQWGEQK